MEAVIPLPYYDHELNAVHAIFEGFLTEDEFRDRCNTSVAVMEKNKLNRVLVDTGGIKVMTQESQQWIQEDWFPRAIGVGLKDIAMVMPRNVFGKTSVEAANKEAQNQGAVNIRYFIDKQEAVDWIKAL